MAELCLNIMAEMYCLFCETGFETKLEHRLEHSGYTIISSLSERNVVRNGKIVKELRPLIPGYIFISREQEPDWKELRGMAHIFYPLRYSDGGAQLRGGDLLFVRWLKQHKAIGVSKAVQIGNYIKIVAGPLKEYEGKITKINKRRKCAEVLINTESIINKIWLSYELIERKE